VRHRGHPTVPGAGKGPCHPPLRQGPENESGSRPRIPSGSERGRDSIGAATACLSSSQHFCSARLAMHKVGRAGKASGYRHAESPPPCPPRVGTLGHPGGQSRDRVLPGRAATRCRTARSPGRLSRNDAGVADRDDVRRQHDRSWGDRVRGRRGPDGRGRAGRDDVVGGLPDRRRGLCGRRRDLPARAAGPSPAGARPRATGCMASSSELLGGC